MTVSILTGDCIATMQGMPAGTFQTCVTSPPYYGLRDYGVAGQIGLEDTPDAYIARMVDVFREVRRVLRDDGTCWLNIGDSYAAAGGGGESRMRELYPDDPSRWKGVHSAAGKGQQSGGRGKAPVGHKPKDLLGIPWMLAFALRADGWYLRSAIVWHKPNPMPESVRDRPTSAYEMVFLLTKRAAYYYDAEAVAEEAEYPEGSRADVPRGGFNGKGMDPKGQMAFRAIRNTRNARNVWTIATQPYSGAHFATMPPDLAELCIKAGTSEKGQCPHCGKAWGRVVERTAGIAGEASDRPKQTAGMQSRTSTLSMSGNGSKVWQERGPKAETTGWSPSCDCPEHAPVPQAVLDPFGGAGTTGLVADRLGRHATLCELNPEYARLARERITADAPLLGAVA